MIQFILSLLLVGIVAGFLARLAVPGPDPMGFWTTVLVGVVGSFVGGFLASLLFEGELALRTTGLVGSVVGAIIVVLGWRFYNRRRAAT